MDTNPEVITVLASNHAGLNTALSPSVLHDVKLKRMIESIFVEPWNQYMSQCKKNSIALELEELSTLHFPEQSTEATSMQVDGEPTANCKLLKELIQKETQAETKALQKEVKQLCDQLKTIKTKDSNKDDAEKAKNKQRGQAHGTSKKKEMAPAQNNEQNHQCNTKSSRSISPAQKQCQRNQQSNQEADESDNDLQSVSRNRRNNRGPKEQEEDTECVLKHQEAVELKHIWMQIKLAFRFIADPSLSTNHNTFLTLSHMPAWYYFDWPSHLAFHDLTSDVTPPKNLCSLLGLGLKFCLTPRFTTSNLQPTLDQFKWDLWLKTHFASNPLNDTDTFNMKMYVKSHWTLPDWNILWGTQQRFHDFTNHLKPLFCRHHGQHNLLPHQRWALSLLHNNDDLLVVQCDKNLGPAIIEKLKYIKQMYHDHLNDSRTYRYLSLDELFCFE